MFISFLFSQIIDHLPDCFLQYWVIFSIGPRFHPVSNHFHGLKYKPPSGAEIADPTTHLFPLPVLFYKSPVKSGSSAVAYGSILIADIFVQWRAGGRGRANDCGLGGGAVTQY